MVDEYDILDEQAKRANRRARRLAERIRGAGVYVAAVTEATLDTDAELDLGDGRRVQVSVDGSYEIVTERDEKFTFGGATKSASRVVSQLAEELARFIKERVKVEPPQVFHCDKCGLFNPLEHLKAKDIADFHLERLDEGQVLQVQLRAVECPVCGAWVGPMSPEDAAAVRRSAGEAGETAA